MYLTRGGGGGIQQVCGYVLDWGRGVHSGYVLDWGRRRGGVHNRYVGMQYFSGGKARVRGGVHSRYVGMQYFSGGRGTQQVCGYAVLQWGEGYTAGMWVCSTSVGGGCTAGMWVCSTSLGGRGTH